MLEPLYGIPKMSFFIPSSTLSLIHPKLSNITFLIENQKFCTSLWDLKDYYRTRKGRERSSAPGSCSLNNEARSASTTGLGLSLTSIQLGLFRMRMTTMRMELALDHRKFQPFGGHQDPWSRRDPTVPSPSRWAFYLGGQGWDTRLSTFFEEQPDDG